MARLVFFRIAGALLTALALCPLVPLLGRTRWPAWFGPFLGALFGVAIFRTRPAVKIVAALALGLSFNLFREIAGWGIADLTRWSLPIGFFAGCLAFLILAVLPSKPRWIAVGMGLVLIAGVSAFEYGLVRYVHQEYRAYRAERQWQQLLASKTTNLPPVDRVVIAAAVPEEHGWYGKWIPGPTAVLTGPRAERFAAVWRSRRFLDSQKGQPDDVPTWYVTFESGGHRLLQADLYGSEICKLENIHRVSGRSCVLGIGDAWETWRQTLAAVAPAIPAKTQSAIKWREGLGQCQAGELRAAIESFKAAIELAPTNAEAFAGLAEAYVKVNDIEHAVAAYTTAIKLHPSDPVWLRDRGAAYLLHGDYQKAVDDFSESLKLSRTYEAARTYHMRGLAYLRLELPEKAVADFNAVLADNPDFWDVKYFKEEALRLQRQKSQSAGSAQ